MKIRTKLFVLTGITVGLSILIAAVYFWLMLPTYRMQDEKAYMDAFYKADIILIASSNRMVSEPFLDQYPNYIEAKKVYLQKANDIDKVIYLPQVSPILKEAVSTIAGLRELAPSALDQVDTAATEISKDIQGYEESVTSTLTIINILNDTAGKLDANLVKTNLDVTDFVSNLNSLDYLLSTSTKVLEDKEKVIGDEILKAARWSNLVAATLFILLIIIALLLSYRITFSISTSLRQIEKSIETLALGDFTGKFKLKDNSELGHLANKLNIMQEKLTSSLRSIKTVSEKNLILKNELTDTVSETTSSATQIEANTNSILGQMKKMGNTMEEADQEVLKLTQAITSFDEKLKKQNFDIEQSASIITEMMASIRSVSLILKNNLQISHQLVTSAEKGKLLIIDTFDKISQMADSATAIEETVEVITQVASQTNLLAMNAAIEAAHAGNSGKGFSVVADEISKLADATSQSTKEISHTIQTVMNNIQEVTQKREGTIEAFLTITQEVKQVAISSEEVSNDIGEMETGSQQILSSIENLKQTSESLTKEFEQTEKDSQAFKLVISHGNNITQEVVSNIQEIKIGLEDIARSVRKVSDTTKEISDLGNSLEINVKQFVI